MIVAFSHSFSPEFYFAEAEPYDGGPVGEDYKTRPLSVWQAILALQETNPERWADLARDVFACDAQCLTAETVLDKIRETDTVGDLRSPVDVWIDREGYYRIDVYDRPRDNTRWNLED